VAGTGASEGSLIGQRSNEPGEQNQSVMSSHQPLPVLLTVVETAALLRTTRKGIYAMIERGLLPGVTRIGRRVLVRSADLLDFLDHNRAPSPQEYRR